MSINGSVASFLPFTINGLTDASFSNSNLGVATATSLTLTSATPLKLARFDLDKNLVSASVDESEVAVLTSNVFDGTQTMKPGHTTNINNVFETTIIANPPYDKSSFTTSGISGYTAPLGTLTGPSSGEYSISQTASDRSIMKLSGFIPEVGRKYVYTFTIRIIDAPEAYVSVEQGGAQRSNTIIQIGSDNETISDTFTFDPSGSTLVFKIYTGSLDPWTATWSSFSLGYYEASINAPINNLTVTNLATELLAFPSTITNSESWSIYAISTMGNPSTLGGLVFQEATLGVGAYITNGVVGATSFQFNTLSGNAGKVVCTNGDQVMSTTINASQLDYITGLTSQAANSITTGSNKITQEYNATVGDISTLVNRATLDAGLALVPNLLPLNNTWTGTYNQFNGTVSTMGSNRFIQPYNAVSADISTLVNRATLDGAIAGLGAGILTLNNTWSGTNTFNSTITVGAEYTSNLNGGLRTLQNATQFNPSLDANSYFITGVFPTTYTFSTNWIVNPVSGTTANIALDPAVFYFDTNHKYVISFTGIYGTSASWVGTVFNNSTSTTVSDASIAITTSSQNLSITFTAGSSNPTIYLRFVGASGTLRWTNFTIKEVDVQILGNLTLSSDIDSNIILSNGRTAHLAGGLKVNQTSLATATSLTTASLPAGVSASTLSGSYTLTATAGGTTFGMWLGSGFTYTAGAKYTFTFTGFSTNATATQAMILYVNTYTGGTGTFIGDYIVNVPITSSTVSGFFTATSNNNVVFNFVSSASGRSISFTGFTLTRADTEIPSNLYAPRITTATSIAMTTAGGTLTMASNGRIQHASGDNSYTLYGPNSSWGKYLAVGSTPDVANATTAQVIGTNGDLFLDAANSKGIYYGNYASGRGTPNFHTFYGNMQLAGNEVIEGGYTFKKIGGNAGQNYFLLTGEDSGSSPYITFYQGNTRRMYVGNASATDAIIASENGARLVIATQGVNRMLIATNGDTTLNAGKFIANGCIGNINGTTGFAVQTGYMATGSLTIGDTTKNYGGGAGWNFNTAGLMLECLDNTEIAVHDAGAKVVSMMYFTGANNTFTLGRDMSFGAGVSNTTIAGVLTANNGINVPGGAITCANQPFVIVGAVGGASIGYGAGTNFGTGGYLYAYTSAGYSNSPGSGWASVASRFWATLTGRYQVNFCFYWNNFAAGSRAVMRHFNSGGGLLEDRYCALNGGGIGADTTQNYSTIVYMSAGSWLEFQFQSGSGTLYFGGITHTHCSFHFIA